MNVQRYLWLVAVALMAALAGCVGGSGSSGFDITENATIQEAIDTRECQEVEALVICPAESGATVVPSATPTATFIPLPPTPTLPIDVPSETPSSETMTPTSRPATATATEGPTRTHTPVSTPSTPPPMQVDTNLSPSSDIVCAAGDESLCSFEFFFVAIGFPQDAIYRTALRENEDQPWTISEPTDLPNSQPGQASFEDDVRFDLPSSGPVGSEGALQFAVLVFLSDPGELPSAVDRLGDTGANFAYVLPPVPVSQTVLIQE